jgi:SAM-dependent methyltransferase
MGRYSTSLAPQLADLAGVEPGQIVLDVGCGPGALTGELVGRLGPSAVSAVDPSQPFVAAVLERYPGVNVQQAAAENLPFPDRAFDAALAQLVVHFMPDPILGLGEMARVTRKDGVLAACVWDHGGSQGPLAVFWRAAHEIQPNVEDQSHLPGAREGHLVELFNDAGLRKVEGSVLTSRVEHPTFDEWWEPFMLGVGPAGSFTASLDLNRQADLRDKCREMLPTAPFVVSAHAWAARGIV